jgi:hypothetical protein
MGTHRPAMNPADHILGSQCCQITANSSLANFKSLADFSNGKRPTLI